MTGKRASEIDPGPSVPVMELVNAKGERARINAEPEFEGDEDDRPAVKAHAKAVKEHQRHLAEWAKRGYKPAKVKPADDADEAAPEGAGDEATKQADTAPAAGDEGTKPKGRKAKAKAAKAEDAAAEG